MSDLYSVDIPIYEFILPKLREILDSPEYRKGFQYQEFPNDDPGVVTFRLIGTKANIDGVLKSLQDFASFAGDDSGSKTIQ